MGEIPGGGESGSSANTALEVFFRGRRTYIQGSLILSLAAAWPGLRLGLEGPVLLEEAAFTSLQAHGVQAVLGTDGPGGFGTARFSVGGARRTVRFEPIAAVTPPRVADEPSRLESLALAEGLNGEVVAVVEGFGGLLSAVIEANKRIHELALEGAYDVWFTGLRKAALPVDAAGLPGRVRLVFTNLMQRRQGEQRQSLCRVEIFGDGAAPGVPPFLCSFACKVPAGSGA